ARSFLSSVLLNEKPLGMRPQRLSSFALLSQSIGNACAIAIGNRTARCPSFCSVGPKVSVLFWTGMRGRSRLQRHQEFALHVLHGHDPTMPITVEADVETDDLRQRHEQKEESAAGEEQQQHGCNEDQTEQPEMLHIQGLQARPEYGEPEQRQHEASQSND